MFTGESLAEAHTFDNAQTQWETTNQTELPGGQTNLESPTYLSYAANESKKLFLGGLKYTETEDTVREHFQRFGQVEDVLIPKHKVTGRPRGFGFVTFTSAADANNLVAKIKASPELAELNGRHVDIKIATPRVKQNDGEFDFANSLPGSNESEGDQQVPGTVSNRIFVGGLPDGVTNTSLKDYFSSFGTVIDSFVLLHPMTKRPRGFGFVTFKDKTVVPTVLRFDKHIIAGKRVETRLATTRSNKPTFNRQPSFANQFPVGNVNQNAMQMNPAVNGQNYMVQNLVSGFPGMNNGTNINNMVLTQQGLQNPQQQLYNQQFQSQLRMMPMTAGYGYNYMQNNNMSTGTSAGNPFPMGMQPATSMPNTLQHQESSNTANSDEFAQSNMNYLKLGGLQGLQGMYMN